MSEEQNTVTLYKITITRSIMMSDLGCGYSLRPWGNNTDMIEGHDDGGEQYVLPQGFEVSSTIGGEVAVFRGSQHCPLVCHPSGRPQIVSHPDSPVLKRA